MNGYAAFGAGRHFVFDANIGKRAAHHHFMIASARAKGVKVLGANLAISQIAAGWTVFLDSTCR